jgi:hypothetical protein
MIRDEIFKEQEEFIDQRIGHLVKKLRRIFRRLYELLIFQEVEPGKQPPFLYQTLRLDAKYQWSSLVDLFSRWTEIQFNVYTLLGKKGSTLTLSSQEKQEIAGLSQTLRAVRTCIDLLSVADITLL